MPRPNEADFLFNVLKGNIEAIRLCQCLARVSQVIDDLIDKDKPVTDEEILDSYWACLVSIPTNPFYLNHFCDIQPIVRMTFLSWMDANFMEKTDDHGKNIAFVLRDQFIEIVIQCAYLIGGYEWAKAVSIDVRKHAYEDSLESYKEDLT
jgi:hypothetical protein